MPEIAEVARIVHFIKQTLVGKTFGIVKAQDDANVFGKVGTSAAEIQKALSGKKVVDAGQQGKYFWLVMSSPPHPVMHFGMTGWFYIRGLPTAKYVSTPEETEDWPPKFWKFSVETKESPKVEAAFADSRRFGRVRLLDCNAAEIRKTTPLKENGPDPVIDRELFTLDWFEKKMLSKKVPVKALLLDQANISGIGNWVGDEVLYHAKLHPEQYSDTFTPAQLKQLHTSILHICQTAVDLLADSSKFPDDWLFKHRWGKGKKDAPTTLPNGAKITFLTVGGRTSCVVPSIQKKTGPVAADVSLNGEECGGSDVEVKKPSGKKRKLASEKGVKSEDAEIVKEENGHKKKKEMKEPDEVLLEAKKSSRGKKAPQPKSSKRPGTGSDAEEKLVRRRSGRVSKG